MLNNQTRKSLVETYKIFGNAQKVAEAFGVTRWTVYRLNEQFENTGSVELKTSARGRKTKLSEENLCQISNVILETPDITLQEIIDKLQLDCSISVLCRAIRNKLGFTRKKKFIRSRTRYQEKRTEWTKLMKYFNPNQLVFLDETGVNIDMTRLYGRSIGNTRIKESAPINTPKRRGVVGAMRFDGTIRYRSFDGSITGKRFLEFLKYTLAPSLRRGDIVVMDNLSIHKVKGVDEIILSANALPLYLPPYSPDLNPIELLWSKLKNFLRSRKIRDKKKLKNAVRAGILKIVSSDCVHCFYHSGYC